MSVTASESVLQKRITELCGELGIAEPLGQNDMEKATFLIDSLQGGVLIADEKPRLLYQEMVEAFRLEQEQIHTQGTQKAEALTGTEFPPSPSLQQGFQDARGEQKGFVGLALPQEVEPPFRSYVDFLRGTLNPQRFGRVKIPAQIVHTAARKWFTYQCWRKPNAFSGKIDLKGDIIMTISGIRGGGKTGLLMNMASNWDKIIALYGSLDDEILGLLRLWKYIKKFESALILGPKSTSVKSSYDYKYYEDVTFKDIESHDIIVLPQKIHPKPESFSQACEHMSAFLLKRPYVTSYWCLVVTEAANIMYARQSLKRMKLDQAKAYMIWLLRQLRHAGMAIGMDSQYLLALDKEVRGISDYIFLKNPGAFSLPRELSWIYGYTPPQGLRALYPNEFVATDKFGGVFTGWFRLPPWHKNPKEDIYREVDVKYDMGDPELSRLEIAKGEQEDIVVHGEIVKAYSDPKNYYNGKPAIKGTARVTGHDKETVRKHIKAHFQDKTCSCFETVKAA